MTAGGSPFECSTCSVKDKEMRNCANALGLSDGARAVTSYSPEAVREMREKGALKVWSLGDLRLYECPLSYISAETAEVMRAAYLVESTGVLFYRGGWAEQPCWLVEAFEIFRAEFNVRRDR